MSSKKSRTEIVTPLKKIVPLNDSFSVGTLYQTRSRQMYCIKPSNIDNENPVFSRMKKLERKYLKKGKQLWIVIFLNADGEVFSKNGFVLTDLSLRSPNQEHFVVLDEWFEDLHFVSHYIHQIYKSDTKPCLD